jgi:hypothetical protein
MKRLMIFAAMGLAACISDPSGDGLPPMCEETSDCDSASGEICDEGICWGDPPEIPLAAVLQPTGEAASSLVRTEIPALEISRDGTISGLQFVAPVKVAGKVTLFCSVLTNEQQIPCGTEAPIAASIRVVREPAFPGAPRFRQTFTAVAGGEGAPSFVLTLPPTLPDAGGSVRPYQITITPETSAENSGVAAIAPPVIVPPFEVTSDTTIEWKLGDPETHRWVSSCLRAGAGFPDAFKELSVAALVASESGELTRVSSSARTDDQGCFSLRVPVELEQATFRFQPGADRPDPTVLVADEPLPAGGSPAGTCYPGSPEGSLCFPNVRGPDLVVAGAVTVPIVSRDTAGGTTPVGGAAVRFFAPVPVPVDPDNLDRTGRVSASIDVRTASSASAGQLGEASANLRLSLTYEVSVIPGSDAKEAALVGQLMTIENPGVQQAIQLGRRVAVVGTLLDSSGFPVESASITAEPTLGYRISQEDATRPLLEQLQATTTSSATGEFILWIDGPLDLGDESFGDPVVYNIQVAPPFTSAAPLWRFEGIFAEATDQSMSLGALRLPEAAYVRGLVTGPSGEPVPQVEVHVYEPEAADPCDGNVPEAECPAGARRLAIGLSGASSSVVQLILPNP